MKSSTILDWHTKSNFIKWWFNLLLLGCLFLKQLLFDPAFLRSKNQIWWNFPCLRFSECLTAFSKNLYLPAAQTRRFLSPDSEIINPPLRGITFAFIRWWNLFYNRFLFVGVKNSKLLELDGRVKDTSLESSLFPIFTNTRRLHERKNINSGFSNLPAVNNGGWANHCGTSIGRCF